MRKNNRGFSLIELMVVLAIIGLLAAVAYPSYQNHMRKGHRAAAQSYMLDLERIEEQYLFDVRQYSDVIGLGLTAVPADVSNFYNIAIAVNNAATPPSYTITATPIAGTVQASDGVMVLNSNGTRTRGGNPW